MSHKIFDKVSVYFTHQPTPKTRPQAVWASRIVSARALAQPGRSPIEYTAKSSPFVSETFTSFLKFIDLPLLGGTDYYECGLAPKAEPQSQYTPLYELVQLILIFLKEIGVQEQSEIPMKSMCSFNKHGQPKFEPQSLKLKDEGLHFLILHQPR